MICPICAATVPPSKPGAPPKVTCGMRECKQEHADRNRKIFKASKSSGMQAVIDRKDADWHFLLRYIKQTHPDVYAGVLSALRRTIERKTR